MINNEIPDFQKYIHKIPVNGNELHLNALIKNKNEEIDRITKPCLEEEKNLNYLEEDCYNKELKRINEIGEFVRDNSHIKGCKLICVNSENKIYEISQNLINISVFIDCLIKQSNFLYKNIVNDVSMSVSVILSNYYLFENNENDVFKEKNNKECGDGENNESNKFLLSVKSVVIKTIKIIKNYLPNSPIDESIEEILISDSNEIKINKIKKNHKIVMENLANIQDEIRSKLSKKRKN